jgi:probable phosphoglycerate mutase
VSSVVLWRHAPTSENASGRLQGTLDFGLDDAGRERARWAARRIVDEVGTDLRVFSGPLLRARETAQALADLVGVSVVVDEAFNQRSYGVWEGLTWDEVRERFPAEFERRQRGLDPQIEGWDGQDAVAERMWVALQRIWDDDTPAVVVSHGSPITLGMLAAIGQPPSSRVLGRVPHAACAMLRRVDSGAWHIEAMGLGAD